MLKPVENMLYEYKANLMSAAELMLEIKEAKSPRIGSPGYGEKSSGGERRDIVDDIISGDERVARLEKKLAVLREKIAPADAALKEMEGTPERRVVWLLYIQGLRVSEVSRILGWNRKAVESRRIRGLVMFAGHMQSKRTPQSTKD